MPFVALHYALGGEGLRGTQLAGLPLRVGVWKALDPYHFYRTPQLALPWVLLVARALLLLARRHRSAEVVLLWLVIFVTALILNMGSQKRWFYALPIVPALCLLMAAGAIRLAQGRASEHWKRWFLPLHWALIQGVTMGLLVIGGQSIV